MAISRVGNGEPLRDKNMLEFQCKEGRTLTIPYECFGGLNREKNGDCMIWVSMIGMVKIKNDYNDVLEDLSEIANIYSIKEKSKIITKEKK